MKDTQETKNVLYYMTLFRDRSEIPLSNDNDANRTARRAISQLSSEGVIFIPVKPFTYRHISLCTPGQIMKFAKEQDASLRTQYFNKLHPLKKYLNQQQLNDLYFGGLFDEKE